MAGCRDCSPCTMPAAWRLTRLLLITWWAWMLKAFVRTCPQCGHMLARHSRRADGSFRD